MHRRFSFSSRSSRYGRIAAAGACFALALSGCNNSTDGAPATSAPTTPATSDTPSTTESPSNGGSTTAWEPSSSSNEPIVLSSNWIQGTTETWAIDDTYMLDVDATYLLAAREDGTVVAYDISAGQPEQLWERSDDDEWLDVIIWGNWAVNRTGDVLDIATGDPMSVIWADSVWNENPQFVASGDTLVVCGQHACNGYAPDGSVKWNVPDVTWNSLQVNGEGYVAGQGASDSGNSVASGVIRPDGTMVALTYDTGTMSGADGDANGPAAGGPAGQFSDLRPLTDGWLGINDGRSGVDGASGSGTSYFALFASDGTPVVAHAVDGDAAMPFFTSAISSASTDLPSVTDWENHLDNPDPWLACDGSSCTINGNPVEGFASVDFATALGEGGTLLLRGPSADHSRYVIAVVEADGHTMWQIETGIYSFDAIRPDFIVANQGVDAMRIVGWEPAA